MDSLHGDLAHHQNLIDCSSYHCQAIPKISSKSIYNTLSDTANRQTDRQTNKTYQKHKPLGRGNKFAHMLFQ